MDTYGTAAIELVYRVTSGFIAGGLVAARKPCPYGYCGDSWQRGACAIFLAATDLYDASVNATTRIASCAGQMLGAPSIAAATKAATG
jgi:hypothetical protein